MKEGWTYKKLDDICSIVGRIGFRGYTKADLVKSPKDGAITLSPSNIVNGELDFSKCTYINWDKYYESPEIMLENGDIVLVKTASIGKCAVVKNLPHESTLNPQFVVLKKLTAESDFICYYLKTPIAQYTIKQMAGGVAIPTLSQKKLGLMTVPVPPLSEQQSIVDYLDSAFAKIDTMKANTEKALNEAKALFQASLKEMLEPKEGWLHKKLGEVCWYNKNNGIHKGTRYVGMEHIEQGTGVLLGTISSDEVLSNTFAFSKGDVLYGRLRPYLKKVIVADFDGCCSTEIFPVQSKDIAASFLMYWFLTDEITNKVNATCAGCRMPRGNMNDVLKFDISYPPHSEQQSIVATLDSLKSKVDRLQANYDKISQECDALKQAILRQVFE